MKMDLRVHRCRTVQIWKFCAAGPVPVAWPVDACPGTGWHECAARRALSSRCCSGSGSGSLCVCRAAGGDG
jgi:hypothetical protein